MCSTKHPAYCEHFPQLNYDGGDGAFVAKANGTAVKGSFFGQSSFANVTIVSESSLVNVTGIVESEEELRLFAPLGCGFQTGAGTVIKH